MMMRKMILKIYVSDATDNDHSTMQHWNTCKNFNCNFFFDFEVTLKSSSLIFGMLINFTQKSSLLIWSLSLNCSITHQMSLGLTKKKLFNNNLQFREPFCALKYTKKTSSSFYGGAIFIIARESEILFIYLYSSWKNCCFITLFGESEIEEKKK